MGAASVLRLALTAYARAQLARGPVRSAHPDFLDAGWVTDHFPLGEGQEFDVTETRAGGKLRVKGDSRLYLVQNHKESEWANHKYMRIDMSKDPLSFTLDLSGVPCGCLACVYMVAMADPEEGSNSYCGERCRHLHAECTRSASTVILPVRVCCVLYMHRHGRESWTWMGRRNLH